MDVISVNVAQSPFSNAGCSVPSVISLSDNGGEMAAKVGGDIRASIAENEISEAVRPKCHKCYS